MTNYSVECWDIEEELNEIIFKYQVDACYPKYRLYTKAMKLLKKLFSKLYLENVELVFIGECETDINMLVDSVCKQAEEYVVYSQDTIKLENLKKDVTYVNVSFYHRDEISLMLCQREYKVISIYDYFEENNLYFQSVFYDIYDEMYYGRYSFAATKNYLDFDINAIFFRHRRLFETSVENERKQFFLRKMLFDCVYAKDFLSLKKYIEMLESPYKENYISFYGEVEKLLNKIKIILSNRKDDIILIWLDALEYGEDIDMPYLCSRDSCAIVFQNAYTVTPYTNPTFRTLLTGKQVVEDCSYKIKNITEENSNVLKSLNNEGYSLKYYGMVKLLENKHRGGYYPQAVSITQLFWDSLRDICLIKEKYMGILHSLVHTHLPHISMGLEGDNYLSVVGYSGQKKIDGSVIKRQACESRKYVDKQLEFYCKYLPKSMVKIYLSDHGHTRFGKFHTVLKIENEHWKPTSITDMFTYKNFPDLLLDIIYKKEIDKTLFSEYVVVQDVDYYNEQFINKFIEVGTMDPDTLQLFGYQGVITQSDMLITYNNDVSYYLKHVNDEVLVTEERLNYLKSLMSKKRINIWEDEHFKGSRLYYRGYENAYDRQKDRMELIKTIIINLFDRITCNKIIGVRGGGINTQRLLSLLPYTLLKKIAYIIDCDKKCLAGRIGIKVIEPSEIEKYKIDVLVISSYDYRECWKKEYEVLPIEVIEIYDELEKEGISCEKDFYKLQYQSSDFTLE